MANVFSSPFLGGSGGGDSGGMSLGTMGSGLGALGSIGGGIFSAITGSQDASAIANIQKQMAQTEMQENQVRRTAMEVESRRQSMQNIRQTQMARSMSLNTATGQGAQFGSVLGGAYGSISGQSNTNELGISQNRQFGEKMFDLTDQLDKEKMDLAGAQSKQASDSAFGKLLGGIGGSLGDLGKLAGSSGGLSSLLPLLAV